MIHRTSSLIRNKAIAGSLSLMTMACALAQTTQPDPASSSAPLAQPVPLVSGSCASIRQGGVLSLEWNPAFDSSWAVTGLKAFRLIFQSVLNDGISPNPASKLVVDSTPSGKMTAIGNGFFHIEARLPLASRLGVYHLVVAHSSPELVPNYQGDAPKMTVSPVSENLCITVVPGPQAASSPPPE